VDTPRDIENLECVAVHLTKEQAIALATRLLYFATEWEIIAVTAWRKPRTDGTHKVTVTAP
jgi:hypothetical protein